LLLAGGTEENIEGVVATCRRDRTVVVTYKGDRKEYSQ
jgi:hypothetical protein